ncbi:caspase family protein [Polaribacter sp.]|uniref:caspase family protein n=1 Tax=Polaribacter sp. TaxID=1920175 RepID=UPI003EF4F0AF
MKKIIFRSLLFIFYSTICFSQTSYSDYSYNDKKGVLIDDFNDNRNKWPTWDNSNERISIENGAFYYESKNGQPKLNCIAVPLNNSKNWEIELKLKYIAGEDNNANGLTWGSDKDKDDRLRFNFSGSGFYRVDKSYNKQWSDFVGWTKSSLVNKTDYNLLTVRKIGNKFYLFLNKTFITSFNYLSYGNKIGIHCNSNTTIKADYLKVSYLEKQKIIIDNSPPQITITSPDVSRGFKIVENNKRVTVKGKAIDESGIFEVLINGQDASLDSEGNFSKTVLLAVGANSFTVKATDIKQNSSTEKFIIERQSTIKEEVVINNQNKKSNTLQIGKYYGLIIGNNNYDDPAIISLDQPINDAAKLFNVLTREYTFEPQNVTFLKNATYVQMIEAFDDLSNKITENDNLIVFYAGHGWWDDAKELGYWLPSNAKKRSTAYWIRNSTISDYMSSIKSKHTLLIADACFSGSIFKTRAAFTDSGQAINSLYDLPSKTAMTSGNLKEVPDKSVFLEYLVKRLDQNADKYLTADQLFVSFRIAVMNNSNTEPQFGTIQNAGDEGGEFIFIRK